MKKASYLNWFLILALLWIPSSLLAQTLTYTPTITPTVAPTVPPSNGAYKILFYYSSNDPFSNLPLKAATVLQAAGNIVTVVDTGSTLYDPTSDNWMNYDQVWDCRFDNVTGACGSESPTALDNFNTTWQNKFGAYVQAGGKAFLLADNVGFANRDEGIYFFLQGEGAISNSLTKCTGSNGNDVGPSTTTYASTLPGTTQLFTDIPGGIPLSLMTGTSFAHSSTGWVNTNTDRSIAAGWTVSQMSGPLGPCIGGKLFVLWDESMWNGSNYESNPTARAITDNFTVQTANWLGSGFNCVGPTLTNTCTSTGTRTTTSTATLTSTPTNTVMATWTNTLASTMVYTATFTPSPATTSNGTNTVTDTATSSATNTCTNTATHTTTNTPTNTATATATNTPTNTLVSTMVYTATFTPSPVTTSNGTNTVTNTMTNTATNTATHTCTNTATNTDTATATNSATNTLVSTTGYTATFTPSLTSTGSFTATSTTSYTPSAYTTAHGTNTVTNTMTNTATNTATHTCTNTATHTCTNTPTPTGGTAMPSATFTTTTTNTATNTCTSTFVASHTYTTTPTNTATNTCTSTFVASHTFTPTPTSTSAFTGTPTCSGNTPTFTPTPMMTCDPRPYPNPIRGGHMRYHVGGGPYERIRVTIYTTSMRKIYDVTFPGNGLTDTDLEWDLRDAASHVVSNGVYYLSVETYIHGTPRRYIEKVLILL